MAAGRADDKSCPTVEHIAHMTVITFEDGTGVTGSNADKAVLKTECMDACVSERTDTAKSYCCQADITPDAVDAPTTYTSTCSLWSYNMNVFDAVDKATDATNGVQCASANILAVTDESADADSSINLAISVATTMAITMFMY